MSWIGLRRQSLGTPRTTIRIFGAFLNHPASPRDPRDYVGRGEEGERKIEREREREREAEDFFRAFSFVSMKIIVFL